MILHVGLVWATSPPRGMGCFWFSTRIASLRHGSLVLVSLSVGILYRINARTRKLSRVGCFPSPAVEYQHIAARGVR